MEGNYTILKDLSLLVQKFTGVFTYDEYTEYSKKILSDPDWEFVTKVLTDLRGTNLDEFYKKIDTIVNYRKETIRKKFLNVFIVDSPMSTVVALLYKDKFNDENYKYEYCSTIDHALILFELEDHKDRIKGILKEL